MNIQVKTPAELAVKIEQLVTHSTPFLSNLWMRWQDERGRESIKDYGKLLAEKLPAEFSFVKMTARPFAMHFSVGDQTGYKVYCSASAIGWSRKIQNTAAAQRATV